MSNALLFNSTNDELQEYFAAATPEKIGEKLFSKVTVYDQNQLTTAVAERFRRAYLYYYGLDYAGIPATSSVVRGGEQGELAEVRVNHSRALVQTLLNLVVAPKIVWTPVATNNDYSSASQAILAASILEYYWQDRHVAAHVIRAVEEAIVFTEGFIYTEWDEDLGEDFALDPDVGTLVKTGDIRFTNLSSWDVVRDSRKKSWEESEWVIIKLRRNKYALAAKYPDHKDILAVGQDIHAAPITEVGRLLHNSDDVNYYVFFHKPTPVLPSGRKTAFLSGKVVLEDDVLNGPIPLHRCFHSELVGTPYAYSPFMEILGLQELIDSLHSCIATNQTTFGTQTVAIENGSEVAVDQIAGGMKAIYYEKGSALPTPLQLVKSPPEVFKHLADLKHDMEQLMGLNSVVRGTPDSSNMSGAALALLQSQALQQSSVLQAHYIQFIESLGTGVLNLIKSKATMERRIAICGKANKFLQSEQTYTGESIGQVNKVMVEIGNPMSQTAAGRAEIAQQYMQMGFIKTPEQFEQVLATGRLEPLTQSLQNELLQILSENEDLAKGAQVPALPFDDHMLHYREHKSVLANPQARKNPTILQAVLAHLDQHEELYYTTAPQKLVMAGIRPPPMPPESMMPPPPQHPLVPGSDLPPPGMMGPPPGPGPGPNGPPPPGGPKPMPIGQVAPGSPAKTPDARNLPHLPTNPATKQKWNPVDGGGAPGRPPSA